jgi:hypothetical protein
MAGCAELPGAYEQGSSAPARAKSDEISVVYRPQIGFVRGTRPVLAKLGSPLEPAPGPNRAVQPCRAAAWAEAAKLGARDIEAVSAGPERLNEQGQFVGRVRMRITYQRFFGSEVREATMACAIDRAGKVVNVAT